jgi:hypothetical protein
MILILQESDDAISKEQFTGLQHPIGRRNVLSIAMKLSCLTARQNKLPRKKREN